MAGFTVHNNIVADYWPGDEVGAPVGDPLITSHVQVYKQRIAYNQWQRNRYGDLFAVIIVPIDWYPQDRIEAANGKGGFIRLHETGAFYMYIIAKQPLVKDESAVGWMCLCGYTVDIENPVD